MANLAGFMPIPAPGTTYGGNWSQPYSGIMDTLLQAQQAGQQRAWDQSLSGPSFNRRFGGMLPMSLNAPSAPVQQQADPQMLAALQGALAQAVGGDPASNFMAGVAPGGGDLLQHSGSMQSQPWYDEYLAAHEAGAPTPMLQNMGGRGLNEAEQAGITARRQERLGGLTPMAERRQNVQNKALYAREQNAVDSGNMSPNQQYFNELARLQGALGGQGGGGSLMTGVLFGPDAMVGMDRNNAERDMTRAKLDFAGSPAGWVAGAFANGQPTPDVYAGQQAVSNPLDFTLGRVAAVAKSPEEFTALAGQAGVPPQVVQQELPKYFPSVNEPPKDWTEWAFGSDRKFFGIPTPFTDPNRSTARALLGNYLADYLGVE